MSLTEKRSFLMRGASVDVSAEKVLVADLRGSSQEVDLSSPPNCCGFGRIRHFERSTSDGWPSNPLPIDPACSALGVPVVDAIRAQVFQNAACNWKCWYCFVPGELRSANSRHGRWFTAGELLDMYLEQSIPPAVVDLTGGQPGLAPEWLLWMMEAIRSRGLEGSIYLWSDDNLSTDYFWRYLTEPQIDLVARFPCHGRVGCFKGFDEDSFAFNTGAEPHLFDLQFRLFARYLATGLDCYAYVTLTCLQPRRLKDALSRFIDRLQGVHELLPLRTVPLEIRVYTPVVRSQTHREALKNQQLAVDAWCTELEARYPSELRRRPIHELKLS